MESSSLENPVVRFVAAFVLAFCGRYLALFLRNQLQRWMIYRKVDPTVSAFAANSACAAMLVFVVLSALEFMGLNTSSLIAMVGAAGLAVGLALQGSLSNLASGILLILFRPFKVGDFIEAAGVLGVVEEIRLFTTQLKSGDNKVIIVPNSKLSGDNITNYSAKSERRIDMIFSISYNDDIGLAKTVIETVLKEEERVLLEPAPTIGVLELGSSSINIAVRPWVLAADFWPVKFALLEKLKVRLEEAGCSIPFPQQDIHVHQVKD